MSTGRPAPPDPGAPAPTVQGSAGPTVPPAEPDTPARPLRLAAGPTVPPAEPDTPARTLGATVRFATLAVLVAALAVVMLLARPSRAELIHAVAGGPWLAPVVAVLGAAALVPALAPRTLLAAAGGALFGTAAGSAYVVAGVTAGAMIAFAVGRLMGREFVAARLGGRLALIEASIRRHGAVAVLISRLIPLVPFGVANYAFGTTAVRPAGFVLGTLLGVVPATVAYAALGSAAVHGNGHAIMLASASVLALGAAGSAGTYLVWRRRPRGGRTG